METRPTSATGEGGLEGMEEKEGGLDPGAPAATVYRGQEIGEEDPGP